MTICVKLFYRFLRALSVEVVTEPRLPQLLPVGSSRSPSCPGPLAMTSGFQDPPGYAPSPRLYPFLPQSVRTSRIYASLRRLYLPNHKLMPLFHFGFGD